MLIPRSPHGRRRRGVLRCAWASLALAVVLVGLAAPPSSAAVEGVTAEISVQCSDALPDTVMVFVSIYNATPEPHVARVEVSGRADWPLSVGAGTVDTPGFVGGYTSLSSQDVGASITVGVALGIGSSYVHGPTTYTNPCTHQTGPSESTVRATEVWVFCNEDEAEPRLFVGVALENDGPNPELVRMELSGRPDALVSVPASSFLTAGTSWTMAEAGDEVHVVVRLESLDLVLFEGSFPNVCVVQPEPPMPNPGTPEPAPATPEAPLGSGEGQVLETAMPVVPVGAGVAGHAAEAEPGVLPRTGASTVLMGAVAALLLVFGVVLTRIDSHDGAVAGTVRS